jgi:sn-glycerol 3-phosphate transport system substrate-binding protein
MSKNRLYILVYAVLLASMLLAVGPAVGQEPVEIRMWIAFTDYRLDWTRQKAEVFNAAYPQYNVVVEGYNNYEELFAATALAAEQGNVPAIVQYFEAATQDARDSGYFKSIAQAIGERTEVAGQPVDFADIIGAVSAYYTLDGTWTSMPWNTSSAIMFSNMTMLEAAGVDAPPATWAEVEAACEQVMALEDGPDYCFTFPNHGWFFEQWLAQQDAVFANNSNGREARATEVAFNSDAGAALLSWLDDMAAKGYLYYSGAQAGASWGTVDQAFFGNQVAMAAYSSSDTALYTNTGNENGYEVAASFLPYNDETGWTGNLIGGASLWLADGLAPEVEDGALTWLLWMTNTENAIEWHQVTGYIAIRQSSIDLLNTDGWYDAVVANGASQVWMDDPSVQAAQGQVWYETNPNFIVASNQLSQSTITPATQGVIMGAFPAIRNYVTQAIDTVLLTDQDPAAVLDAAAAEANQTLAEYNLLNAPE